MRTVEDHQHAAANARGGARPDRCAEWAPRAYWVAATPLEEAMTAKVAPGADVEVYANEGRWVVQCPDCNGAQLASRSDRRFMCNECANVVVGGGWRRVIWPAKAEEIEAAVRRRPRVNQNWLPGESVTALHEENAVHGVRGGR